MFSIIIFVVFVDIFTGTFFNVLCTQQYRIQDTNRKKKTTNIHKKSKPTEKHRKNKRASV